MGDNPLRIVQISDVHLCSDSKRTLLGVNTHESFLAVLDLLRSEQEKIDFLVFSGDMSQDASVTAYKNIATLLQPFQVPVYCVPGNHDDPQVMASVYPCDTVLLDRHILLKNWQIILLSSHKPGAVEGYLDHSQLHYLQQCLQAYPEHQAIVMFHHQPIPVGSRWLDQLGLTNAHEFWQTVAPYSNVKHVFFGHVHQVVEQEKNGIHCYSAPATCIQFMRKQAHFGLENLPPGYRWIHLYENGQLETGIKRTAQYIGVFDAKAKGY